ncbi:hypothetical protein ACO0LC_03325 [Undibacterium sp. JH2W]|uniref:HzsA-related protein n=1 Tax=Undibacterium sp. JH2W TaxID=3413037 RepID=UPI003BF22955
MTNAGENNHLHWLVQGAKKLQISPDIGEVSSEQNVIVHADISKVYTLTATDASGNVASATLTLDVNQESGKLQSYPIMFVTQVPLQTDQAGRLSAFANHLTDIHQVPRGGDLMLHYPDGSLRNLTREAGFGMPAFQGAKAIAVREPAIHWDGQKALFSMLIGAQDQPGQPTKTRWQIYEVTGLGQHQKAKINKLAFQDENFNNLSPLYASDESIIFTSDRPHNGQAHLYPQLDEYEATPSISGIWKLNPANGHLQLLSHTPSGAFNPIIDSYGRLLFTRWDHLQQDQLADRDRDAQNNGFALPFHSFNYVDESLNARKLSTRAEVFPESRIGSTGPYGKISGFRSNFFTIWQINQDGTTEETLNHLGQHELAFGPMSVSFSGDVHLKTRTTADLQANRFSLRREAGLFHLREDPLHPGTYYATDAREAASYTTNHLVKLQASPDMNPEKIMITPITITAANDILPGGRYRNPLPLSDGRFIASHTSDVSPPADGLGLSDLRLKFLNKDEKSGLYSAGSSLTGGLHKSLSWWEGKEKKSYQGALWELEAVEVRSRPKPWRASSQLEAPERAVLAEEAVSEAALQQWLINNELALIVTRDQTSRDRADMQQPYNLQVPGGKKTISSTEKQARVYDISHFQIVEASLLRAYENKPGRRALASFSDLQKMHNPALAEAPPGSVKIASDGSTAAFVPAGKALSWQTTDEKGNAIVRERNWITFQRGEMRVCTSCHGVNSLNQAGLTTPTNKPQALRELLGLWKALAK